MKDKAVRLGKDPAYPSLERFGSWTGLTKREYFAGLAMQGLLNSRITCYDSKVVNFTVKYADALLEELSKEPENE